MTTRIILGETSLSLRKHLCNMLAIIAENREALKIERGSPNDKDIVAARKMVIETQPQDGDEG